MAKCGFIPDGYTLTETIPETERLPAVTITFRPMLGPAVSLLVSGQNQFMLAKDGIAKAAQLGVDTVMAQLVSWDLTDHEGKAASVEAKTVARLDPDLFEAIFSRITGWVRPSQNGETTEAAAAKNSQSG